jgi:hypothetical protein
MPYAWETKPSAQARRTGYRTDPVRHREVRMRMPPPLRSAIAAQGGKAARQQCTCQQCGVRFRRTHGNQKYCPECRKQTTYNRHYYVRKTAPRRKAGA